MRTKPATSARAFQAMLAQVPGPSLSPLRQGYEFGQQQYRFLEDSWKQLGDVFTFRIPGEPPRLIVAAPQEIKKIFALRPEDYFSGDPGMHVNIGESCVLFADGEPHRRDRQLLTPPLHGAMLAAHGDFMRRAADQVIDGWSAGQEVVLQEAMAGVTLDVITRCVLGAEDPERARRLAGVVREWLAITLSPAMFVLGSMVGLNRMRRYLERRTDARLAGGLERFLPLPGRRSFRLKAELMRLLTEDVERCRREGAAGRTDVLALVALARHEDGQPMALRTVLDQLTLLLMAGHETTAKSMCWVVLDVLRHPEVLARIRDELTRVLGTGPLVPARCRELVYLQAVIKESMRLTPVTTVLQRELTRPLEIGGYQIPAGVVVAPSNFLAQRHPDAWTDPLAFRPERFLDRTPAPYEYFPFGGGRRRCLGVEFASFEMPIVLATLLRRVDLRLAPGADPSPRYGGITIGPADGLRVRIERLRSATEAPLARLAHIGLHAD